jgi:integrase
MRSGPVGGNDWSARAVKNAHLSGQARTKHVALGLEIEPCLQVEPEALRRAEVPRQAQRGVGADRPLAMHDLIDPARRDRNVLRLASKAKVGVLRPHGPRHTSITAALDRDSGDVRKMREFSRHSKIDTLLRYDGNRRDSAGEVAGTIADLL